MSAALPSPLCCPASCDEQVIENLPGPQGEPGSDGAPGVDGIDAFTSLTASFVQPAVNANVTIEVVDSQWMTVGQDIFVENGGYYQVISKADSTHATIKNLGYTANVVPTTVVPNASHVSPAGEKGEDGSTDLSLALLRANNLTDLASAATARTTGLGATAVGNNLFILTSPSAITFLRVNADNSISTLTAAQMRAALGLAIGTDVQAFNALLTALAVLSPLAGNRFPYTTASNAFAAGVITTFGLSLVDDADVVAGRVTLGKVLPRFGLLGSVTALDLNVGSTDTAVSIEATRYILSKVTVENASASVTTATLGVFTLTAGGGVTLAADQGITALTASDKWKDLTLSAAAGTDVVSPAAPALQLRVGTPQGVACTANVFLWGYRLD